MDNVKFIELKSCPGGCIGGVLNVENPFVASSKLARLRKSLPKVCTTPDQYDPQPCYSIT